MEHLTLEERRVDRRMRRLIRQGRWDQAYLLGLSVGLCMPTDEPPIEEGILDPNGVCDAYATLYRED